MKKMRRLKMLLLWMLIIGLVLPFFIGIVSRGVTQSDIDLLKKKKAELAQSRKDAEAELGEIRGSLDSLIDQKLLLDKELVAINDELDATEELIAAYEADIAQKEADIAALSARSEELYSVFRSRIRVMYEDGQTSYLALLLDSGSINDFLDRVEAVGLILSRDKKVISELRELAREESETLAALEESRAGAEEQRASLELSKADAEEKRAEADAVMAKFEALENESLAEIEKYRDLEDDADAEIASELAALAKQQEAERKKKEEEERKRLEEERKRLAAEEKKRLEEQEAKKKAEEAAKLEQEYKNSAFIWPVPGFTWITDDYGYRTHPITKDYSFHSGVDVGVYLGTPILASAAGTVISNTYNSAYGYMVKIDHGNGYVTLYAHMMRKSSLKVGASVKKGQTIGYVGSTGLSTGPHLHFGLYKNGSAVNPLDYMKVK